MEWPQKLAMHLDFNLIKLSKAIKLGRTNLVQQQLTLEMFTKLVPNGDRAGSYHDCL